MHRHRAGGTLLQQSQGTRYCIVGSNPARGFLFHHLDGWMIVELAGVPVLAVGGDTLPGMTVHRLS